MRIYVSFPYGKRRGLNLEQLEINVQKSIEIARQIVLKGHNVFVPNLFHYLASGWEGGLTEEQWMELSLQWIEQCDALYCGGFSEGCVREYERAKELHKPIYFFLKEIPEEEIIE